MKVKFKVTRPGCVKLNDGNDTLYFLNKGEEYEFELKYNTLFYKDFLCGLDFSDQTLIIFHEFGYFEGLYLYFTSPEDKMNNRNLFIVKNEKEYHRFYFMDNKFAPYGIFTSCISSEELNKDRHQIDIDSSFSFLSYKNICDDKDNYLMIDGYPHTIRREFNYFSRYTDKGIYHLKENIIIKSNILQDKPYIDDFLFNGNEYFVEFNRNYSVCKIFTNSGNKFFCCNIHDLLKVGYIDIIDDFYYPCREKNILDNLDSLFYKKQGDITLYKKCKNFKLRECNFSDYQNIPNNDNIKPLRDLLSEKFILNDKKELSDFEILFLDLYANNKSYWHSLFKTVYDYEIFKLGFKHFSRLIGSIQVTDDSTKQILHLYFMIKKMVDRKDPVHINITNIRKGIFNHKMTLNNGMIEFSFLIPKNTLNFSYKNNIYNKILIDQIDKDEILKWIEQVKSANTETFIRTKIYQNGEYIKESRGSDVSIMHNSRTNETKISLNNRIYANRNKNFETRIHIFRDIYEGTEEKIYDSLMELLFIREHDCSGRSIYTKNILTGKENFMIIDESDIEKEMESYQILLRD